ncbi:MAG TPA: tripartite tricarboxylate transporter substrate binding protein [Eoetvoesiella sp.]
MNFRLILQALLYTCIAFGPAQAAPPPDAYPSRPIRMIVPYSAGGNTDALARLIAQRLSETIGQPVIVDNRPGGNTLIGTEAVARAPADGYTLLLTTLTFAVVPSLYKKIPYDGVKDFTPITLAVTLPNVLVINPKLPVSTIPEFIAYAKSHPGKLNYASTGSGTSPHLSMELLKMMSGINVVHVPYKGGGPAMIDLLGGQIQAQFIGLPVAIPQIESGKLRALGVTSSARSTIAPNIPTIGEFLPGYEMNPWFGILGPADLPKETTDFIQQKVASVLHDPEMKKHLLGLGAEPVGSTPTEFAAYIKSQIADYKKIVKEAGIELQ